MDLEKCNVYGDKTHIKIHLTAIALSRWCVVGCLAVGLRYHAKGVFDMGEAERDTQRVLSHGKSKKKSNALKVGLHANPFIFTNTHTHSRNLPNS